MDKAGEDHLYIFQISDFSRMSTIGPTIVIGLETNVGLVGLNVGLVSLYFGHGIVFCGT